MQELFHTLLRNPHPPAQLAALSALVQCSRSVAKPSMQELVPHDVFNSGTATACVPHLPRDLWAEPGT
jgi:hypothetical protein